MKITLSLSDFPQGKGPGGASKWQAAEGGHVAEWQIPGLWRRSDPQQYLTPKMSKETRTGKLQQGSGVPSGPWASARDFRAMWVPIADSYKTT